MSKRRYLRGTLIALAAVIFASCSTSKPYCGESFCLTETPKSVSKETPVEDFNLYRIELSGRRFLIYEGNHPNTEGDKNFGSITPNRVPSGFAEGKLYGSERGYQVVLRTTNPAWPTYVAVSLATKDPSDLDQLLSKLRAKKPNES